MSFLHKIPKVLYCRYSTYCKHSRGGTDVSYSTLQYRAHILNLGKSNFSKLVKLLRRYFSAFLTSLLRLPILSLHRSFLTAAQHDPSVHKYSRRTNFCGTRGLPTLLAQLHTPGEALSVPVPHRRTSHRIACA